MAIKLGRCGEGILNLSSTVLPLFHISEFSLYNTARFINKTYGYTRYINGLSGRQYVYFDLWVPISSQSSDVDYLS